MRRDSYCYEEAVEFLIAQKLMRQKMGQMISRGAF